jgi:hypothetical protein
MLSTSGIATAAQLRLALNHQTAMLSAMSCRRREPLRLALNHQTAMLGTEIRSWKQGLIS